MEHVIQVLDQVQLYSVEEELEEGQVFLYNSPYISTLIITNILYRHLLFLFCRLLASPDC